MRISDWSSDVCSSDLREGRPFLVDPADALQPAFLGLVPDIGVEETLALHLVTLGKTQHLSAQRGQAAIEGIKLVDEIFDLRAVELDAFDLGGQVLAQLLIFLLFEIGRASCRERVCQYV